MAIYEWVGPASGLGGILLTELLHQARNAYRTRRSLLQRVVDLEDKLRHTDKVITILARGHQAALKARYEGKSGDEVALSLLEAHAKALGELADLAANFD